jgi:hypothetical protein
MERKQKSIFGAGLVFLTLGVASCHHQATNSHEALRTRAQELAILIDAPRTQRANQTYRTQLNKEYQRIQHELVKPSTNPDRTYAYLGAASTLLGLTLTLYTLMHAQRPVYS